MLDHSIDMLRSVERKLLLLAGLYLLSGAGVLFLVKPGSGKDILIAALLITGSFLFLNLLWSWTGFAGDPFLLPIAAFFCFTSLVFLYRLNPIYAARQFTWLIIGLFALALTTRILLNYKVLANYKYLYAVAGAIVLLLPIFFGTEQGGAKSWLQFGIFNIQTSEFVKILLVLFFAAYLSEKRLALIRGGRTILGLNIPSLQEWGPLLMMLGISLIFLVFQKDLGTTLIFFSTFLAMVYAATARIAYISLGGILFLAGGAATYLLFDHVKLRVLSWLNPWQYAATTGYQVIQSMFALAAGGLTGAGLGAGFPHFIPAVHTDFIFAAVTEELGLSGALALLVAYMSLIYRGFIIAMKAGDAFSSLLAAGLTALMGLQSFIIIGGVTKLLPLTGVTLPFISYGGSSLVANFIILGLLLNISHRTQAVKAMPGRIGEQQ